MQSISIHSGVNEGSKEEQGAVVNRWGPGNRPWHVLWTCEMCHNGVRGERDKSRIAWLKVLGSRENEKATDPRSKPSSESSSTQAEWPPDWAREETLPRVN